MSYLLGLDLGQARDYTALTVAERIGEEDALYHVRHLQRFELHTPYPVVVRRVVEMLRLPQLADTTLIVDATGVGRPVVDLLHAAGLDPVAVTITGGDSVTTDSEGGYRVPKRDLVGVLQVLFQTQRLKIAAALPDADTLTRELLAFEVKITTSANDTYGAWREGAHDDLVLAVALACWWGERYTSRRLFFELI